LTSALAWTEWSASRPSPFTPGERAPDTEWIGDCVRSTTDLHNVETGKNSPLPGLEFQSLCRLAHSLSLYRLRYSGFHINGVYGKIIIIIQLQPTLEAFMMGYQIRSIAPIYIYIQSRVSVTMNVCWVLPPAGFVMREERTWFDFRTWSVKLQTQEVCLVKPRVRNYGSDETKAAVFLDWLIRRRTSEPLGDSVQ
jgi:hypothetical protein